MRAAEFTGGPHPGSYYSPTLPQKRLGEGWVGRMVRCGWPSAKCKRMPWSE
ncbi:hypothetical protein FHS01_003236 [Longimicrobium terrae]|uniref:Uncharacterized protein n=1 Tax=Longimicrobium terrae TaxID=1639882 RepID=A0A841H0N5_9BACT|nr:hypothetical protein [Longimicrobium terrae]MBB6071528.1 hypothetical protein [Longimicrobium terrae]